MTNKGQIISIAHCPNCGQIMVESEMLTVYCKNTSCSKYQQEFIILPARLVEKMDNMQESNDDNI